MRRGLFLVVLLSFFFIFKAGQLPLPTREGGLMVRAGFFRSSVMQELAKRRFADSFDPDKETFLVKAGASPELIVALEHGRYSISTEEAARVQQKMAKVADLKAAEVERARSSDTVYQSQVARQ